MISLTNHDLPIYIYVLNKTFIYAGFTLAMLDCRRLKYAHSWQTIS